MRYSTARSWTLTALVVGLLFVSPFALASSTQSAESLRIESFRITDSSRDGVFQPGEAIAIEVVITNPTDARQVRPLRLSGRGLALADEGWIEIPPGSSISPERPLAGILDPTLEARSRTVLQISLGDTTLDVALWISHSPELGGEISGAPQ